MSSLTWIRNTYNVPAKRDGRVVYSGGETPVGGTILGACGQYLRIRLDGHKKPQVFHPKWKLEYQ